ncbi:hypothetical protein HAX54_045017 [Datura stramonium]|uniref:Uncharacterized protein n=1 Tax=Datura stramonium TaxID=4076 RepID=A0ABS8WFG1_DATST|nr:hypothetical protein [Datura stramonium]
MNASQEQFLDSEQVRNCSNEQVLGVAVQNQKLGPDQVQMRYGLVQKSGSKQVQKVDTGLVHCTTSEQVQARGSSQMQLQRSLTGERNSVDGKDQEYSFKSKSKNKLSKKQRDALKKKMEELKENSK